jgi:AhpD family alkylhydroperoxidase
MSRIMGNAAQTAEAYATVKDDPQWTESCRLIERGKSPSEMFRALAVRPDILQALSEVGKVLYPGGLLERALNERVVVAVSKWNDCQYCVGSHIGSMHRLGLDPDNDLLTPREQAALDYTHAALANPHSLSEEVWSKTKAHFTEGEIVELTLLIGLIGMLNRFNDCLGVRYNNDYDDEQ